ncbi:hypothetical protein E2I00_017595, partial [Balaenoptera physalus]
CRQEGQTGDAEEELGTGVFKAGGQSAGLHGLWAAEGHPPTPHHLPFVLTLDSMFPKAALLLGLTVVGIHIRTIQKEFVDISKDHDYFAVSVEFAVAWFNSGHEEGHDYKLLEVRRAQQKNWTMIYLMDLELGRTICKKYDEDINNCPLQEGPEEKKWEETITRKQKERERKQSLLETIEESNSRPFATPTPDSMFLKLSLLLGLLALRPHVCSWKFEDISKSTPNFRLCVEFAKYRWIYLMDLELGRTICKKHDEDIDNCPLQEGPEQKKV